MRVTPVSKEEADANGIEPFKPGEYDFIIHAAEETISKAQNEVLKLTLHVFNRDGGKRTVFDYIGMTAAWKQRHMMEAINMLRRYEQGIIDPIELQGKPGRCKLGFVPAGEWPAKNNVLDYVPAQTTGQAGGTIQWSNPEPRPPASRPVSRPTDLDDDIPF